MNKIITVLVSIIVAGVIVGASLPVFAGFSNGGENIHNDGAGWIRFNYDANASEYEISLTESEDGITITNGSDTQTYNADSPEDFDTILYADSCLSVWADSDNMHVLGLVDGSPVYIEGWGDFTITRTADGVTFTNGTDTVTYDAPTWAYVPWSKGSYGFFTPSEEGVTTYPANMPNAIVGGGFAGVYAYNDIYRYEGLGLVMTPTYNGDNITGAGWAKPAIEPDPQQITITPLDPSVIGGGNTGEITDPITPIDIDPINPLEPDAGLMSVPTPSYTSGDWGYNKTGSGSNTKAIIVSYLGTGGNIVVPATIDGYPVLRFGNASVLDYVQNNAVVFDNANISAGSSLTISEGITEIGSSACMDISNLSGTLTLPSTLTKIGTAAFRNCGFTGSLNIPASCTDIRGSVFKGCSGFTGQLVIPNMTEIKSSTFESCSGFTGQLVIPDSVKIINSSAFRSCSGFTSLGLGSGVEEILNSCFNSCSGFTGQLVLPDNLVTIGPSAFSGCSGFTGQLVIPHSVTTLENQAFYGCSGFTGQLVIPNSITTWPSSVGPFGNCTGLTSILFEKGLKNTGVETCSYKPNLVGDMILPDTIEIIGNSLCNGSNGMLGTVLVPESVITIGDSAFMNTKFSNLIIASDAIPTGSVNGYTFGIISNSYNVLDLSRTVDYSMDRYGIKSYATISDNIGDCFGFISVADYSSGSDAGAVADIIPLIPLVVVAGLVIMAGAMLVFRRV